MKNYNELDMKGNNIINCPSIDEKIKKGKVINTEATSDGTMTQFMVWEDENGNTFGGINFITGDGIGRQFRFSSYEDFITYIKANGGTEEEVRVKLLDERDISKIKPWVGTKEEFEALDKSTLEDGQEVIITNDYEDSSIIDDTASATDKTYSSSKIDKGFVQCVKDFGTLTLEEIYNTYAKQNTHVYVGYLDWRDSRTPNKNTVKVECYDWVLAMYEQYTGKKYVYENSTKELRTTNDSVVRIKGLDAETDILAMAVYRSKSMTTVDGAREFYRIFNSTTSPLGDGNADNDFHYEVNYTYGDVDGKWIQVIAKNIRGNDIYTNTRSNGTWSGWQKLATVETISPIELTFASGTSAVETHNCNYTVRGGMCVVNLASVTSTATSGETTIVSNLPKALSRSNTKLSNGEVVYIDTNSTDLKTSGAFTREYAFLVYPIA